MLDGVVAIVCLSAVVQAIRLSIEKGVVAEDAYQGGVTTGSKCGRGAKQSWLFMVAVEVDETSAVGSVRFDHLHKLSASSLKDWAINALHIDCSLVTTTTDGYKTCQLLRQ